MKRILKSMNPTTVATSPKASSASIYSAVISAATSTDAMNVASSKSWATSMQAQCIQLIHQVSTNQAIHRTCDVGELEYVESEYSDLIEFISGVGASCAELSARLDNAQHEQETNIKPRIVA